MALACFSATEAGLQCFLVLIDESYFPLSVFIGRSTAASAFQNKVHPFIFIVKTDLVQSHTRCE